MSFHLLRKIDELRSMSPDDAAHQCEKHFGQELQRIIRRVIRTGRTRNSLTKTILQQARQVRILNPDLQRDEMVTEVTRRLCARLAGQDDNCHIKTIAAGGEPTVVSA
jgi:hypothetical protein